MDWKQGDWVVFDLKVGQIKELRDNDSADFSDGWCQTSGRLQDHFRPLTLANKRIVETFDIYYMRLREIDGEAGFNYPDIHRYFADLALDTIDDERKENYDKGNAFVEAARKYEPLIDGVHLFRRKLVRKQVG